MNIHNAVFVTSAVKPGQYPPATLPEVAFAGRSNVGKSSLINTLVNRRRLVKTSSRPGRTQLINFFCVNDRLSMVDLPGYGYAKVPAAVQKNWGPMVETYVTGRENLLAVVVLIDIRRSPKAEEFNLVNWLVHHGKETILVLTKADKLSRQKQAQQRKKTARALNMAAEDLMLFSAKSRQGKEALWQRILAATPIPISEGPAT